MTRHWAIARALARHFRKSNVISLRFAPFVPFIALFAPFIAPFVPFDPDESVQVMVY